MRKIIFFFFILTLVVYFISSEGQTPYDYFTRLADAFLDGKYYLNEKPPWLSELIEAGENVYYVVYPPMPAILSTPIRFLFGDAFHQQYLAHILGAGITLITMASAWHITKNKLKTIFVGIMASVGNIIWYLSSSGSSWYLGQVTAAFFLSAAIYESLSRRRILLVGMFIGAAFMSRLHTILSFPIFLYLFYNKKNWFKNYFILGLGVLPFMLFNFYYNYIRFGSIFDKAYVLIPGLFDEPWFKNGLFNIKYIPEGLKTMFLSLPKFSNQFPYITPSWAGLSILITSPIFLVSLLNKLKDKFIIFTWLSILPIAFVVLSHGTTGFTQFGYRFAVDFYPLLFLLIIKYYEKNKIKKLHWFLLFFGVLVNTWGVLCIKNGYVGF